jgi:phage gp46-like protein
MIGTLIAPEGPCWIEDDAGLAVPMPDGPLPVANAQGDILIQWDNTQAQGDWVLAQGDLQTGQDLETACLVSLFSDALATPDFVPTDGTTDRRGWWGDYYGTRPLGSNLWQLDRAKTTRANLGLAQSTVQECLQWLIDDGIAARIIVNTQYVTRAMMGIAIAITRPDGTQTRFMFGWAWDNLATVPSPVRMIAPFG